ncbi:MAG: oxidoreductase [Pseudomonadota bacterium]
MNEETQKIAIVTGANTGLGLETSRALANNYLVVLACRNAEKANAAMANLKGSLPNAKLDFIELDLIDRASIRRFAESFKGRYPKLDLLVNNAGVMGPDYTITANDLELQFDANHIGHFLLTSLLIESLDQEFETRIVNVSSLAAKRPWADIYFDNLNFEGNYYDGPKRLGLSGMVAYSQSKLANVLFTMELKDRLELANKHIKVAVAHPGFSMSDLGRNMPLHLRLLAPILGQFMGASKPLQGAESTVYAALESAVSAGDFIGPTGKNEMKGPPGLVPLPSKASDKSLCEKLWSVSEEKLGIRFEI